MPEQLVAQALAALRDRDFHAARARIVAYGHVHMFALRHYLIQGLAEMALEDWPNAVATFGAAAAHFPDQPQLWFNLGVAQENLRAFPQAAGSFERSLGYKPDQAEACGNLSNVYRRLGRFGEAEEMARRAIAFGAPKAQALNSLGLALGRQAKFAEAEKTLREAMALAPGDAQIAANLANLYVDQLRFEETWPLFVEARAKNDAPAIRHHEGMARLLAGDYQTGWELCEARLQPPVNLRVQPACPRWRGETLIGKKLLLVAEQGQGDTIQFCRYGGLLAKSGAQLAWVMQKSLQCLLAANLPGIVLADDEPLPEADFYLPLLSLPLALGLYAPQNAPPVPYLRAPVKLALPAGDGESRKIGLVWSGSKTHERDAERSIPLARFAPLWEKTGAKPAVFYAPFIGEDLEQSANYPVVPLDDFIGDFADTASLLMQLDCLVTVDTAAAHLAGALGVKTYLLLPYCPDWRWGTKGEATAWYASVTLLRQPQPGDWDGVMARLTDRLAI